MKFKSTASEYLNFDNLELEVLKEFQTDIGTMYKIRLENGVEMDAFPEEIIAS